MIHYVNKRCRALHRIAERFLRSAELDKQTAGYELAYLGGRDPIPDREVALYIPHLRRILGVKAPLSLLEIGAGTGRFTIPLAKLGHRVAALEPAGSGLETLGRKAQIEGVRASVKRYCGTFEDLRAFKDRSFDACIALQSIMYEGSKTAIVRRLGEMARITRRYVIVDFLSKYGYLLAGIPDVPPTVLSALQLVTTARLPQEDTLRAERVTFATYEECTRFVPPGCTLVSLIPIDFAQVMDIKLPTRDAVRLDRAFFRDRNMRNMSMYLLLVLEKRR